MLVAGHYLENLEGSVLELVEPECSVHLGDAHGSLNVLLVRQHH